MVSANKDQDDDPNDDKGEISFVISIRKFAKQKYKKPIISSAKFKFYAL